MAVAKQEIDSRRLYVGCSEIGAVMGEDPYKTPLDLFNIKLGLVEPFAGNRHTERGEKLEAVAAREFTAITGLTLRRRSETFVHPEMDYFRGHIDRLIVGQEKIAEIKCPSAGSFSRIKREGIPKPWYLQLQGYLLLSRKPTGTFIIFNADQWDLIFLEFEADKALFPEIESAVRCFWNHVLAGTPPPAVSADKVSLDFSRIAGEVVKRTDPEFLDAAQEFRDAHRLKADAEAVYEFAKTRMKEAAGAHGKFEGAGVRLHFGLQEGRRTFDHKRLAASHPELNLEPYFKQGEPFEVLKPYFLD